MAAPTVSIVVNDTALAAGETSLVTFTFSEAVTGFTAADLVIANGTLSPLTTSDNITYTATFTPTAQIADGTNVIILNNAGVSDGAAVPGVGTTSSNNYAIDTARPTVTIVLADTELKAGESTGVTITFSEAVSGLTNAHLSAPNGTLSMVTSSDGGITWRTNLTPTAAVADATNVITLDKTGVADQAGNAGTGTTDSSNYAVSTVRPTVTIMVADTALKIGETSAVAFTFSEAVAGFSNALLTAANGTLSVVTSSDGGVTWTAILTPTAATTDTSNLITLDKTGVTNAAGNIGVGQTTSNNYAVDTTRPTGTVVVADTALVAGETSGVTITFSEAVTGFTNADLTVANGTLSAVATSDNITYTATFTPIAGLTSATNVITLDNAGVADQAGNAGTGTTGSNNYAIDTTVAPPEPPPEPPAVAPGTAGPDVVVGDDLPNLIAAGDANDTASGGLGNDTISGAAGDDVLQGNSGNDSLAGGAGADVVLGGQGDDQVQGSGGADYVSGDKGLDTIHGGQGDDIVYGAEGDDYVSGDKDNDIVRGGQGNDLVLGGDGNDYVSGDKGSDTVTGGVGADLFHTFAGAGVDRVTDFSLAQGDRVMLDVGTVYTVAQLGADTVIDLEGGGQMTLAGIQLSTLTPGWIFAG